MSNTLMKNTILEFDKLENDDFIYNDYTSRNFKTILTLPETNDPKFIDFKELSDDQTIELASQDLYDTPDYWDILLLIGERDPLFDMPYDHDVLVAVAKQIIEKYKEGYSGEYVALTFDSLEEAVLNSLVEKAEKLRTLKIIKPERLNEYISVLRKMNKNV